MKVARTAGPDASEVDHILHSHPILLVLLHILLNAIRHGYVPTVFYRGIIIPLLKNKQRCYSDINNYRTIILHSAIAEIFYVCT